MRLLTILSIILVIFIITGIYTTNHLLQTISDMRDIIPTIEQNVDNANWETAEIRAIQLKDHWNEIQDHWDFFIMHQDIESVELLLIRVISYISSEDNSSALAELAALDMQLGFIYRNEIFNLQNVF